MAIVGSRCCCQQRAARHEYLHDPIGKVKIGVSKVRRFASHSKRLASGEVDELGQWLVFCCCCRHLRRVVFVFWYSATDQRVWVLIFKLIFQRYCAETVVRISTTEKEAGRRWSHMGIGCWDSPRYSRRGNLPVINSGMANSETETGLWNILLLRDLFC